MTSFIQTPTNDISQSLDFYGRLNFKTLLETEESVWITDGKAVIEINSNRFARAGVKLYKENWTELIEPLKKISSIYNLPTGHILADPSGVWIYLENGTPPLQFEPSESSSSILGNYAGLSLETIDIEASARLWNLIGFDQSSGHVDNGWITLANSDGMMVSLMKPLICPHLFFNPSLTYFNGKINNPVIIEKIRSLDIPIAEEITHFNSNGEVDNIIIRDPGGYGFFIFND